jgi:hypothetical protein
MHRAFSEEPGQQRLQFVVMEWNELWHTSKPELQVYDDGQRVRFVDTRPCAIQRDWTVEGLEAEVYRMCDSAQKPTAEMSGAADRLLASRVLLLMNGKFLALGVNQ